MYCSGRHNINPIIIIESEISPSSQYPVENSTRMSAPSCSSEQTSTCGEETSAGPSGVQKKNQKRKLEEDMRKSEMKTEKVMRKAARSFVKFMEETYNILVDSSDSD